MNNKKTDDKRVVSIEEALDITGFGIYSYGQVLLTGLVIVSFACHAYSNTVTIPTSACELGTTSAQQGLIGAAPIVGLLLGAVPLSYLADRRGRKNLLILSLLVTVLMNMIRALSVNWIMLLIMEFIVTFVASGQYMLAMTLLSECVPLAKRNIAVLIVTSIFLPAQGILAVMAIPVIPLTFSFHLSSIGIYWNSWRTLQVIYSIPSLITAFILCFITESPKFYLDNGDEKQAMEILRMIHKRNKGQLKEFPVTGLIKDSQKTDKRLSGKEQLKPLFKMPLIKFLMIILLLRVLEQVSALLVWFPTIANRFMQMIETGAPMDQTVCDVLRSRTDTPTDPNAVPCSLNNTAMLIVLANGTLQSILNLIMSTVVNKLGRRNIVIGLTSFSGVCGILVNVVPNTIASSILFILYTMGYIVVGLHVAIGVSLFPTQVRAVAVAIFVSGGRVATSIVIQIINYLLLNNCDTTFYVLGSVCIASALVASALPDDRKVGKQRRNSSQALGRSNNTDDTQL